MTFLKKLLLIVLLSVLIVVLGLSYYVVEKILPYSGIKPQRINAAALPEFQKGILPSDYGLDFENFDIQTKDSITIKAYLIKAEKPRCTLILVHGIGDCKEHFYPFCQKLKEIGCQTLILDLRAHGQSGGTYCTFFFKQESINVAISSFSL